MTGIDEFRRLVVEPLFTLASDIRTEVDGWAAHGDVIYLAITLRATIGAAMNPEDRCSSAFKPVQNHIGSAAWMSALRTPDRLMQQSRREGLVQVVMVSVWCPALVGIVTSLPRLVCTTV